MIPPWTKLSCVRCGNEELATRTEPKPEDYEERFVCGECETYEAGFREGWHAALAKMEASAKEAKERGPS